MNAPPAMVYMYRSTARLALGLGRQLGANGLRWLQRHLPRILKKAALFRGLFAASHEGLKEGRWRRLLLARAPLSLVPSSAQPAAPMS